jgi:hypothetical protein
MTEILTKRTLRDTIIYNEKQPNPLSPADLALVHGFKLPSVRAQYSALRKEGTLPPVAGSPRKSPGKPKRRASRHLEVLAASSITDTHPVPQDPLAVAGEAEPVSVSEKKEAAVADWKVKYLSNLDAVEVVTELQEAKILSQLARFGDGNDRNAALRELRIRRETKGTAVGLQTPLTEKGRRERLAILMLACGKDTASGAYKVAFEEDLPIFAPVLVEGAVSAEPSDEKTEEDQESSGTSAS